MESVFQLSIQVYTLHFQNSSLDILHKSLPCVHLLHVSEEWCKANYGKDITFHGITKNVSLYFVKYLPHWKTSQPIPMAARSKACLCGRSLGGTMGSNSGGSMDVCCVSWGRGLCGGLITRPEESCRVWCLSVSVVFKPRQWWGSGPLRAHAPWKKKAQILVVGWTMEFLDKW